ncbi:MAG: SemiSWEET transporter [Chlorobiaceae bacterium]|nr:SemiSWEET transporter [Chlorobiaceae bacterium]
MTLEIEYIGFAAGVLTTFGLFPQALRMLRTRQARDVSLTWVVVTTLGVALWLCYGLARQSPSIITANGITLVLFGIILVIKLRHG